MIRRLTVKGLNNRIDADLEFHSDLNIMTGANGSGKTTLLKLIWYLISGHLSHILAEIPFRFISIQTEPFAFSMERVEADRVTVDYSFGEEKRVAEPMVIDAETGRINRKDVDRVHLLEKRIARTTQRSLFFPTFRRIEGGFSRVRMDTNRFLAPTPERLQVSMSRFVDEVSINGHKFIASISTADLSELLTQKYADIYEEISRRQAQVLEEISTQIQNNPDKVKVSAIPPYSSAVLDAIQKVNKEREQLSKPLSVLSELSRKILRYDAIHVAGQGVHAQTTDGITLVQGNDGITTESSKDAISSDKLSAGEKQMLSFLCYNAFSEDTPIFIDEPELSLHVDWQRRLLPTLLKQGQKNQFFIATHSPFIYSKYPDKEFMLDTDRGDI